MNALGKALILVLAAALVGCTGLPDKSPPPASDTRLIVILVGGNSEAAFGHGLWKLYQGRDEAHAHLLLDSIRRATGLTEEQIVPYYFSWTGDGEDLRPYWLPGHGAWVLGGADHIEATLRRVLLERPPFSQIAVVGWSNGGGTAYELACMLGGDHRPSLLVTLDPVALTTRPCTYYSDGLLETPANWVNVHTSSEGWDRLKVGNVVAWFGNAWNENPPSLPGESYPLAPADHGDTAGMWCGKVLTSGVFTDWAASFATGRAQDPTAACAGTD